MKRTASIIVIAAALLGVGATAAQAQSAVFPPLVSGEYVLKVQNLDVPLDDDGVPLTAAPFSTGIFDAVDESAMLVCFPVAPGTTTEIPVVINAGATSRVELRAKSFSQSGCGGLASEPSPNGGYVYTSGPAAPVLVE